jgi:2-polyprenyl-3-methyl-5-hydroxy-6-metoxy-1,4-benzoquinol methylase
MFENAEAELWEIDVCCDFCGNPGPHTPVLVNVNNTRHNLVECDCGLRFFAPRLSWEWMQREIVERDAGQKVAYNHLHSGYMLEKDDTRRTPEQQKAITRQHYRKVIGRLQYHVSCLTPRVLDIGSGIGYASKYFREVGFLHPTSVAVELCPHAAGIAKRHHTLDVRNIPFNEIKPCDEGVFDVLFANDYIEHTYTPCEDLRLMRRLAHSDSVLYIKTFAEELDEAHGRTMICPPWHQYHFTTNKLIEVVEAAGWSVLSTLVTANVQVELIARAV